MATTTNDQAQDATTAPKHKHRDEYQHVETLDHLGLIRDLEEKLTPIDVLFNAREATPRPKVEPRHII